MLRILRAFAWMRWRVLVNSLERTGARDTLERMSLAVEQIGPLLAAALLIPSALGLAALSGYAGYTFGSAPARVPVMFEVLRYLLLVAVALSIVGPIMLPAGERTNAVRLLLLPIPRPVLYVAQTASALTDPWNLLVVPMIVAFPVGLAIGGALASSLVAIGAGALLLVVLLGLSSLATLLLHLAMRDRRRGELLVLGLVVVLPLIAMLPTLMLAEDRRQRNQRQSEPRAEVMPSWVREAAPRAFALLPSELFRHSVSLSVQGRSESAIPPLFALAATALVLHGLGLAASGRMLDSPASSGHSRGSRSGSGQGLVLPGMSSGASAVAVNQLRLAFRTSRGRSTLVSPLLVFGVFALLMSHGGGVLDVGFIALQSGLGLATLGSAVCLLTILPFAMNQFAVDQAGLTLQFLSPLSDGDILVGKAAGNGLIAGVPSLICVLLALLMFPGGSPALWLSVPLGLLATYLVAAPAAAALSATFPRAVDLNSIGSRSNAHGLAGVLGMLAFLAASVPPVLLVIVTTTILDRPAAAPVALLIWCAIALVLCRLLLSSVSRLFNRRRENLALVV